MAGALRSATADSAAPPDHRARELATAAVVPRSVSPTAASRESSSAARLRGDLQSVQRWVPGIARVGVDGMQRVCTLEDGRVQHEEISGYSSQTRSFEYAIDGGLPVRDNRGSFAVEPSSAGACVVWRSSFEAFDPETEADVAGMWKGALQPILQNLKTLVESG